MIDDLRMLEHENGTRTLQALDSAQPAGEEWFDIPLYKWSEWERDPWGNVIITSRKSIIPVKEEATWRTWNGPWLGDEFRLQVTTTGTRTFSRSIGIDGEIELWVEIRPYDATELRALDYIELTDPAAIADAVASLPKGDVTPPLAEMHAINPVAAWEAPQ